MHATLRLRRGLAWPFGRSHWATALQILVVLGLSVWFAFSISGWMTQTALDWQPIAIEQTIVRLYPLPAGLAKVDFDVAESVNPQVGARTLDPAKTRYGVSEKTFLGKAVAKSVHTVWLEGVSYRSVRVHYFVQNPGDTVEYYRMYPLTVPDIKVSDKGSYVVRKIDADPDKVEELRAFEVTYNFQQSADVSLAQWWGESSWAGWAVAFVVVWLTYNFGARPIHLGFSKLVYSPVAVVQTQPHIPSVAATSPSPSPAPVSESISASREPTLLTALESNYEPTPVSPKKHRGGKPKRTRS